MQRWENARAITGYKNVNFVIKWTSTFVLSTIDIEGFVLSMIRNAVGAYPDYSLGRTAEKLNTSRCK